MPAITLRTTLILAILAVLTACKSQREKIRACAKAIGFDAPGPDRSKVTRYHEYTVPVVEKHGISIYKNK